MNLRNIKDLNETNIQRILQGASVRAVLLAKGAEIAARADAMAGVPKRTHQGPAEFSVSAKNLGDRVQVNVTTNSTRARVAQAAHNTLLKALT